MEPISRRAYESVVSAYSWEEIFEAGPYYQRVSELLEDARHYAIFVGWQIDSRLPLPRPYRPQGDESRIESLKEKILRLVESKPGFHFYFLMWDHAYFYVLEREAWQGRIWDNLHPRVHFLFDNRHLFGAAHHEKICIIDGTTAFVGGIDLCDERWDSPQHHYNDPRRSLSRAEEQHGPYHDIAVQVTGPVCAKIHHHIEKRWRELSTIPFPEVAKFPPHPASQEAGHRVYVSRTLAEVEPGLGKSLVREIEFLFRDLIHSARHRIILEGQYYWSEEINDMLIAKIHAMKGQDFEVILILADLRKLKALTHQLSTFELSLLDRLEAAGRSAGIKVTIGFPHVHPSYSPGSDLVEQLSKPIYIHSKVIAIDDTFLSIGSANLATRALRVDTEINLTFAARTEPERAHIRKFTQSLLKHWNLSSDGTPQSSVHLHSVDASRELQNLLAAMSPLERFLHDRVPWKAFFDPKVPYFQPLERRFRRLSKTGFPWVILVTAALWAFSSAASFGLATCFAPSPLGARDFLFALALTSVWFAPIPFTLVAALSIFQLGFESGVTICVSSLWVAALQGYWLTRLFPAYLTRFYRASGPSWLPRRLGLRQFPATVSVSLDPRLSLRSKIAYQGLYCVPIPWFAMNFLLLLPSALYVLLRAIHKTAQGEIVRWIQNFAPEITFVLIAYTMIRLFGSAIRKKTRGTSP